MFNYVVSNIVSMFGVFCYFGIRNFRWVRGLIYSLILGSLASTAGAWTTGSTSFPVTNGIGASYSTIGTCTAGALSTSTDSASIELYNSGGAGRTFYLNNRRFAGATLQTFPLNGARYTGNESEIESSCGITDVVILREQWVFSGTQTWATTEGAYLVMQYRRSGVLRTWSASIRQSSAGVIVLSSSVTNGTSLPVASAGIDIGPVTPGELVELTGVSSFNPLTSSSEGLDYTWRQISGPSVILDDVVSSTPTFIAPALPIGQVSAELVFGLVVSNESGSSPEDSVSVSVTLDGGSIVQGFDAG